MLIFFAYSWQEDDEFGLSDDDSDDDLFLRQASNLDNGCTFSPPTGANTAQTQLTDNKSENGGFWGFVTRLFGGNTGANGDGRNSSSKSKSGVSNEAALALRRVPLARHHRRRHHRKGRRQWKGRVG